jgi:hypothetical protein
LINPLPSNRFRIASSTANWNNSANWSTSSGGSGGASVPGIFDVDTENLSAKEEHFLTFENRNFDAIIIRSRQTLLTTFLFYQSLAYMGTSAAAIMAEYERSNRFIRNMQTDMYDKLGGIEVFVKKGSQWNKKTRLTPF